MGDLTALEGKTGAPFLHLISLYLTQSDSEQKLPPYDVCWGETWNECES